MCKRTQREVIRAVLLDDSQHVLRGPRWAHLWDNGDPPAEGVQPNRRDVDPIDQDTAGRDDGRLICSPGRFTPPAVFHKLNQPEKRSEHRALAGSCAPYDPDRFPALHTYQQISLLKHPTVNPPSLLSFLRVVCC